MGIGKTSIELAAKEELQKLSKTSCSPSGFSDEEIDAISSAIIAAIEAYDEHIRDSF